MHPLRRGTTSLGPCRHLSGVRKKPLSGYQGQSLIFNLTGTIFFQYTTAVVMLGYTASSLEIRDLPILPACFRATTIFTDFRQRIKKGATELPSFVPWRVKCNSPTDLGLKLITANKSALTVLACLAATSATLFYVPAFFLQRFIKHLEEDPDREDTAWAWVYCAGLFASNVVIYRGFNSPCVFRLPLTLRFLLVITGQLWSISTTDVNVRFRIQLNTLLFSKTLVRKNVASTPSSESGSETPKTTAPPSGGTTPAAASEEASAIGTHDVAPATIVAATHATADPHLDAGKALEKKEEEEFSSKAQIMTLMTTDVDRVADFAWHLFTLVDRYSPPIESRVC